MSPQLSSDLLARHTFAGFIGTQQLPGRQSLRAFQFRSYAEPNEQTLVSLGSRGFLSLGA